MYKRKSKSEIRAWLKTDEGKAWLIRKVSESKREKARARDARDVAEMKRLCL